MILLKSKHMGDNRFNFNAFLKPTISCCYQNLAYNAKINNKVTTIKAIV